MSQNAVRVEVHVPVDPPTAFRIFTEEVDLWWVRGPANFYDGARARGMRFEAGVGGRFLQVNDGADDRELGRITLWEPGECLAYETDGYEAAEMPRITPVLFYADVPAAADWLAAAFGFWCRGMMGSAFAELEFAGGVVMLQRADGERGPAPSMTYTYVDDLETHCRHARQGGAYIVEEIHRRGDTSYVAEDLEQHRWTFAQARASMRPGGAVATARGRQ